MPLASSVSGAEVAVAAASACCRACGGGRHCRYCEELARERALSRRKRQHHRDYSDSSDDDGYCAVYGYEPPALQCDGERCYLIRGRRPIRRPADQEEYAGRRRAAGYYERDYGLDSYDSQYQQPTRPPPPTHHRHRPAECDERYSERRHRSRSRRSVPPQERTRSHHRDYERDVSLEERERRAAHYRERVAREHERMCRRIAESRERYYAKPHERRHVEFDKDGKDRIRSGYYERGGSDDDHCSGHYSRRIHAGLADKDSKEDKPASENVAKVQISTKAGSATVAGKKGGVDNNDDIKIALNVKVEDNEKPKLKPLRRRVLTRPRYNQMVYNAGPKDEGADNWNGNEYQSRVSKYGSYGAEEGKCCIL